MDLRENIIQKAGELFTINGIRQVTMDTIAQSLGISKRTIYENFKDKNDLLLNFLSEAIMNHKKKSIKIMKNADNVIDALFLFGDFNQRVFNKINPAFFDDIKKYHPDIFHSILNSGQTRNHEITYTILKRGINEGIFRKEIDIEIANLYIHHSMEFFHKIEKEQQCSHAKIWHSVHLPYLRGICTEKGQELVNKLVNKHENLENN
ncbi:TetR/AcrR family transcriptional regulator [Roseimarinus sediminis]|uniref:TetR/AcrR family transcriptional regulator n=1 Tax=Roseimarinus sediminis TaxID=1610899 RepID=UPI003D249276